MAITMTDVAVKHVHQCLTNRGSGKGIRLGIRTTGCSGMAYVLEYVDKINSEDYVFDEFGVQLVIDPKSYLYLDGTELDFVKEGLNEGFKFTNPNEKARCGCGESFSV
jgi:iron-sulfur cluster assembly protein